MLITKVTGGLGNQMFQYAFGRYAADHINTNLFLDTTYYPKAPLSDGAPRTFDLNDFNIRANVASPPLLFFFKIMNRIYGYIGRKKTLSPYRYLNDEFYKPEFTPLSVESISLPAYLDGYWTVEKYYSSHREQLLKDFSPKTPLDQENHKLIQKMNNEASVSIHIRRGDYLQVNTMVVCSMDYYKAAVEAVESQLDKPIFYVFSDDPMWVRAQFIPSFPGRELYVVDHNSAAHWKDMVVMSHCRHNIIANSTFSWWAAWLNKHEEKIVVAPRKWLTDEQLNERAINYVYPNSWLVL